MLIAKTIYRTKCRERHQNDCATYCICQTIHTLNEYCKIHESLYLKCIR